MSGEQPTYLCPKCGFRGGHPTECPRCGLIFAKYRLADALSAPASPSVVATAPGPAAARSTAPTTTSASVRTVVPPTAPNGAPSPASSLARTDFERLMEYNSDAAVRWALPAALLATLLAKLTKVPALLLDYFRVWLHELGHAIVAWCGSRAATPLVLAPGFAWTSSKPGKSTLVYVCFLFLLGVLGYYGYRQRRWFAVIVAAGLFVMQSYFTFVATNLGWEQSVLWSGVGGELILGAFAVVAFYYQLPERLHWDFFRYIFLLIGMYSLVSSTVLWWQVQADPNLIPWGTGFGGRGDANGDMNRLHHLFGWSEKRLALTYLAVGFVGGAAVVAHYLLFLLSRLRASGRSQAASG